MKTSLNILMLCLLGVSAFGCIRDNADRCNGDYEWDAKSLSCVYMPDHSTPTGVDGGSDTDTANTGTENDMSTDTNGNEVDAGSEPLPTGMGEACETHDDCADYEADYCDGPPYIPGYCTLSDCTVDPNDCPSDYICCALILAPESICQPYEIWSPNHTYVCSEK